MEKIKKRLIIEKSNFPDKEGKYILWFYSKTKHGENWQRLFKGTKKACFEKKYEFLNG